MLAHKTPSLLPASDNRFVRHKVEHQSLMAMRVMLRVDPRSRNEQVYCVNRKTCRQLQLANPQTLHAGHQGEGGELD